VLYLDLDGFKHVNDSLGHAKGDQLLIEVSKKIESCVRANDTVARLGGDEFGIILDDCKSMEYIQIITDRILNEMLMPFNLGDAEVYTTASIGITIGYPQYTSPEEILRDADIAMYHAKSLGKSCHTIFDADMHRNAVKYLQLENDLRRAIEREEFSINYQPIVEIESGNLKGFEALLAWNHPTRGAVYPDEFIPIAEETGLILPIGTWVLNETCNLISSWQQIYPQNPPLDVSVNMSSRQFKPNLIKTLENIIKKTKITPGSLCLEITESIIMENSREASQLLAKLREMNIKVYIDDFGTGYSSLSYLNEFQIDALKIDRSFVSRMNNEKQSYEIAKAIVDLAHNLNLHVIAEGVEQEEQLEIIKSFKCQYAQGYFYSVPIEQEKVVSFLSNYISELSTSNPHS
jgi:diguanylate cyclase (GGDEF)-like protein